MTKRDDHQQSTLPREIKDKFNALALRRGVKETHLNWCFIRIEQFTRFNRGKEPAACTDKDIERYMMWLAKRPRIARWQIRQASVALAILCRDILQLPWAAKRDWSKLPPSPGRDLVDPIEPDLLPSVTGGPDGGTFIDSAREPIRQGSWEWTALERLRAELRVRHYSYRTEKTYIQWAERFLAFCQVESIEVVGPDRVKAYLEYLALHRKVSSSTQNQALNALVFSWRNRWEKSWVISAILSGPNGLSGCRWS
jgi:hypothetical protein